MKTEFFANSEASIELKLFKITKIWHFFVQNTYNFGSFSSKIEEKIKKLTECTKKTPAIFEKTQGICEKTQGNFSKTQLSANSELVKDAEFCPKKSLLYLS